MSAAPDGPFGTWLGQDRRALDEALFAAHPTLPEDAVPDELVQGLLHEDEPDVYWPPMIINPIVECSEADMQAPSIEMVTDDFMEQDNSVEGTVRDELGTYQLRGVATGVYEITQSASSFADSEEELLPTIELPQHLPLDEDASDTEEILLPPVTAEAETSDPVEVGLGQAISLVQEPKVGASEVETPGLTDTLSAIENPLDSVSTEVPAAVECTVDEEVLEDSAGDEKPFTEPQSSEEPCESVVTESATCDEQPPALSEATPAPVLRLEQLRGCTVIEGGSVPITTWNLCIRCEEGDSSIDIVLLEPPRHGTLMREGFALRQGDTFTQRDIDQGCIHYRHDGANLDTDGFTFGTSRGEILPTVLLIETRPGHRAPVLTGVGKVNLLQSGCLVAELLRGTVDCCDADAQPGLAVVALMGRGQWQYSYDAGHRWHSMTGVQHDQALLLGPDCRIRFVPLAGWTGRARLSYRAWDQSQGKSGQRVNLADDASTGGRTAFSAQVTTLTTTIQQQLRAYTAEPWEGCPTAEDLLGGPMAVVCLQGQGIWQYSLDDGASWMDFGSVYHGRARLLGADDRIRFLPRQQARGKVVLIARPWNGQDGAPGDVVNLASRRSVGEGTPFGEFAQSRRWRLGAEEID